MLKLQGDERLIAMARSGNAGAFETIVDRYQGRLLGFCRQMLGSTEDAEDVLQEVFVNAYRAMLADEREINLRPWLYRIARNRCLNHLRKPTADAQESMDMVPAVEASSTAEKVHNREEFRQILSDVNKLPETQRSALLLREMDALSYEEIAAAMDTTVPSVKSLLVRARISLAEASQARQLTCGEVRLELSEVAEGLRKASPPVRRHIRECEECAEFRSQIRTSTKALAALSPVGPLIAFKSFIAGKLGIGGAGASGAGAASAGAGAAGAGAVSSVGAALGGSGAASGLGALGGAIGTKAVAGALTAAVITAGAVEVKQTNSAPVDPAPTISQVQPTATGAEGGIAPRVTVASAPVRHRVKAPVVPTEEAPPVLTEAPPAEPATSAPSEDATAQSLAAVGESDAGGVTAGHPTAGTSAGAPAGNGTVTVTVVPPASPPPPPDEPSESSESAAPPPEVAPPAEEAVDEGVIDAQQLP